MIITHKISADLARLEAPQYLDMVQDDRDSRRIEITLFDHGTVWTPPAGTAVLVRYCKPDGTGGEYDTMPDGTPACTVSGNAVTVRLAPQVLTVPGTVTLSVTLLDAQTQISTFSVFAQVQPGVGAMLAASEDYRYGVGYVPMPADAKAGRIIRITDTDDLGRIRNTEVIEGKDLVVEAAVNQTADGTSGKENALRRSVVVYRLNTGGYDGSRLFAVGTGAESGATVRFALFSVHNRADGSAELELAEVLGDAVADESGAARLEFAEGYDIWQENMALVALAEEAVIHCLSLGTGVVIKNALYFDDGDYFACEEGTKISGRFTGNESIPICLYAVDVDLLTVQTLYEYMKASESRMAQLTDKLSYTLPAIGVFDEGKVVTAQGGGYVLAETGGDDPLPQVSSADEGKFLRVVGGVWTAAAVESAEEGSF